MITDGDRGKFYYKDHLIHIRGLTLTSLRAMTESKRNRHFSQSLWLRTATMKYITENSGEVDATDIIATVGRDGLINSELVMNELRALEDDGIIVCVWDDLEFVYVIASEDR